MPGKLPTLLMALAILTGTWLGFGGAQWSWLEGYPQILHDLPSQRGFSKGDLGFGFPSPSSGSHIPTQVTVLGLQAEPGTGIQPLQLF